MEKVDALRRHLDGLDCRITRRHRWRGEAPVLAPFYLVSWLAGFCKDFSVAEVLKSGRITRGISLALSQLGAIVLITVAGCNWFAAPKPDLHKSFLAAEAALSAGNQDEARSTIALLESEPTWVLHRRYLIGRLLQLQGDHSKALTEFGESRKHPELYVPSNTYAAESLIQIAQTPSAINLLNSALARDPKFGPAHRAMAIVLHDLGATDGVIFHCNELCAIDDKDYRPRYLLAEISKRAEDYERAISLYQEALDRNPPPELANKLIIDRASCILEQQDPQTAKEELERLEPSPARNLVLAETEIQLGSYDSAKELLQSVLRFSPRELRPLLLMARLLEEKGDLEGAMANYRTASEKHDYDFNAQLQYAQFLSRRGEKERSQNVLERANQIREARKQLTELTKRASTHPSDAKVRYELASMARRQGLLDTAEVWLRRARQLDPDHTQEPDDSEPEDSDGDGQPTEENTSASAPRDPVTTPGQDAQPNSASDE